MHDSMHTVEASNPSTTVPSNPTEKPSNPTAEPSNTTTEPSNPTTEPNNQLVELSDPTAEPSNPTAEPPDPTAWLSNLPAYKISNHPSTEPSTTSKDGWFNPPTATTNPWQWLDKGDPTITLPSGGRDLATEELGLDEETPAEEWKSEDETEHPLIIEEELASGEGEYSEAFEEEASGDQTVEDYLEVAEEPLEAMRSSSSEQQILDTSEVNNSADVRSLDYLEASADSPEVEGQKKSLEVNEESGEKMEWLDQVLQGTGVLVEAATSEDELYVAESLEDGSGSKEMKRGHF